MFLTMSLASPAGEEKANLGATLEKSSPGHWAGAPSNLSNSASARLLIESLPTDWDKKPKAQAQQKDLLANFYYVRQQEGQTELCTGPALLEDIKLLGFLGKGGFASVYKGTWRGGSTVAVKIMANTTSEVQDLYRQAGEAERQRVLNHLTATPAAAAAGQPAGPSNRQALQQQAALQLHQLLNQPAPQEVPDHASPPPQLHLTREGDAAAAQAQVSVNAAARLVLPSRAAELLARTQAQQQAVEPQGALPKAVQGLAQMELNQPHITAGRRIAAALVDGRLQADAGCASPSAAAAAAAAGAIATAGAAEAAGAAAGAAAAAAAGAARAEPGAVATAAAAALLAGCQAPRCGSPSPLGSPCCPSSASSIMSSLEVVPAAALAESILCKSLAHPNVVQTYTTRCARVSAEFLAAAYFGNCPTDAELLRFEAHQRGLGLLEEYPPGPAPAPAPATPALAPLFSLKPKPGHIVSPPQQAAGATPGVGPACTSPTSPMPAVGDPAEPAAWADSPITTAAAAVQLGPAHRASTGTGTSASTSKGSAGSSHKKSGTGHARDGNLRAAASAAAAQLLAASAAPGGAAGAAGLAEGSHAQHELAVFDHAATKGAGEGACPGSLYATASSGSSNGTASDDSSPSGAPASGRSRFMVSARFGEPGYVPSSAFVAAVRAVVQGWRGCTPLCSGLVGSKPIDSNNSCESFTSEDGFGAVGQGSHPPLSWHDVLTQLGAVHGTYLTVFVMELAEFGSLEGAIRKGVFDCSAMTHEKEQRMRLRALLRTMAEVVRGLVYLHSYNVVHGDLKPANVVLRGSRADVRGFEAMLSDFGLASLVSAPHGESICAKGTPNYMAPETLFGGVASPKGDIYSLGIMLHVLASGRLPYSAQAGRQGGVLMVGQSNNLRPIWPPNPKLARLGQLYARCICINPLDRPSAQEVLDELMAIEKEVRLQGRRPSAPAAGPAQASVPSAGTAAGATAAAGGVGPSPPQASRQQ